MTDQLEGTELWLRVAQVMGYDDAVLNLGRDGVLIRKNIERDDWEAFNPETFGADAWAMLMFFAEAGHEPEIWIDTDGDQPCWVVRGSGVKDDAGGTSFDSLAEALGRAIVEAWG